MNEGKNLALTLLVASIIWFVSPVAVYALLDNGLVDDSQVTIRSATDVSKKRQALIQFIWGSSGFPSNKLPSSVKINILSPVSGLSNLQRVDEIRIAMDA